MQAIEYAKNATQSFALPDICIRIREMLDDGNSSIEDLADVVGIDPSLTSKLLKLANSPLFRFPSQVDSLTKALNIIGGEALYNLLMAETARSAFEHFSNEGVDLRRFWLQSIYAGLIAKHIAKMLRVRGSERFFLLGLLHNFGELVVATQAQELAQKCSAYDKQISPWKLQMQILDFTYAQCSSEVLRLWQLPTQLYMPVAQVHEEHSALINQEVGILFTSVRAAMALAEEDLYSVNQLVNPLVIAKLNLEEQDLRDAIKFARMEASNFLTMMTGFS